MSRFRGEGWGKANAEGAKQGSAEGAGKRLG